MEFLYDRFAEWMRQKLVRGVLSSLFHNMLSIVLAIFLAVTMSTLAVRAIMPVERSRMFLVPRFDSVKDESRAYYGFINVDQSPSAGFPYKADVIFRSAGVSSVLRGKIRLKLRSSSGMVVVDKSAGFKVNGGGDGTAIFTQFSLGRLLAPIYDGTLQLFVHDERNGKSDAVPAHIEIKFSLDCAGDMYTRLLCFRPTKWAVVAWTWAALYSAVMTIAMLFLLATKIMNLFLGEFARTLLRWAHGTVRRHGGRLLRRVRGRSVPVILKEEQGEETVDELIGKIKAAAAAGAAAGTAAPSDHVSYTSIGEDAMSQRQQQDMKPPTIVIDAADVETSGHPDTETKSEDYGNEELPLMRKESLEERPSMEKEMPSDEVKREPLETGGEPAATNEMDERQDVKTENGRLDMEKEDHQWDMEERKQHPDKGIVEQDTNDEEREDMKTANTKIEKEEEPDENNKHPDTGGKNERVEIRKEHMDMETKSERVGVDTESQRVDMHTKSDEHVDMETKTEHDDLRAGAAVYAQHAQECDLSAKESTPRQPSLDQAESVHHEEVRLREAKAVVSDEIANRGPSGGGQADETPRARLTSEVEEEARMELAKIVKLLGETQTS